MFSLSRDKLFNKDCVKNDNSVIKCNTCNNTKYINISIPLTFYGKSKTIIFRIPYILFFSLIKIWSLFDKNPPFTTQQLQALVVKEEFDVIDWPSIFLIEPTQFKDAISETFCHPKYSNIEMEF